LEERFTVGGVVLSAQVMFTPHPTIGSDSTRSWSLTRSRVRVGSRLP
jgi:hypothetical protein